MTTLWECLEPSWRSHLLRAYPQIAQQFAALDDFIHTEYAANYQIYPPKNLILRAFHNTAFQKVRVVIVGQDPYHGANQADGLCFSVPKDIKPPPSLCNILREVHNNMNSPVNLKQGCLDSWSTQGVLMLNSVLSVRAGAAASHAGKGWEDLTDQVIALLNNHSQPLVFMLWGGYAKKKGALIDRNKHLVLEAIHPSPMASAYARGNQSFLGCKHFSQANNWLHQHQQPIIDWLLDHPINT